MSYTREERDAAHKLLVEYVHRHGFTTIYDLYFAKKGDDEKVSMSTLKNVYKENLHGKTAKVQDAIIGFYRAVQAEADEKGEKRLYHILKNVFQAGDQRDAKDYVGHYACYRIQTGTENSDAPNLLVGRIEIKHNPADDSYEFTHVSSDSGLEVENAEIVHTGPFFALVNRVYLVGWGQDCYGAYMRPMILQSHGTPNNVPLRGLVLTESADGNVPVAARTVLLHDELHTRMKAKYKTDNALKEYVLNDILRADARNPTLKDGEAVNATNLLGW